MARKYHTLLTRFEGRWGIEFGAYDRSDVVAEMECIHDGGMYLKRDMKIVTTGDAQADIEARVAELNAEKECVA